MNSDAMYPCLLGMVIALAIASVKGCQAVYNPASLRADAEARVMLHKEFKQ